MASIEFALTEAELADALRLSHAMSLTSRRSLIYLGLLFVFWSALLLFVLLTAGRDDPNAMTFAGIVLACMIGGVAVQIPITRRLYIPMVARRTFKQQKDLGDWRTIEVQPPRIVFRTENAIANTPTENFLKWAENQKIVLLYRSDRLFNMIPKRAMTDEFYAALTAELARAGVRKMGAKKS